MNSTIVNEIPNYKLIGLVSILILTILVAHYSLFYQDIGKTDDAYITFRYSRNLSEQGEFTYNPGERVFGTTAPLWGIILSLFGKMNIDIAHAAVYLSIIMLSLSLFVTWKETILTGKKMYLLFFLIPLLNGTFIKTLYSGMEIFLCLLLLVIGFFVIKKTRYQIIFSFFVLSSRIDIGFFYLGAVLSYYLVKKIIVDKQINLNQTVLYFGLAIFILVIYFATNLLLFDQLIPNTIAAKNLIYKGTQFEQNFPYRLGSTFLMRFGKAASIFLWLNYLFSLFHYLKNPKHKSILVIDFFIFFEIFALIFLIARHQNWYYPVLMFSFITAIVLHYNHSDINWLNRTINLWLLSTMILILGFHQLACYYRLDFKTRQLLTDMDLYRVAQKINPDSTVFCGDIGIIGYYTKDCYIYDYAGLVTPEAMKYNQEKKIYPDGSTNISDENLLKEIQVVKPGYVVMRKSYIFTKPVVESLVRSHQFKIKSVTSEILLTDTEVSK